VRVRPLTREFGRVPHFLDYAGLFWASLLAATVLPFQSEVVLFGMLLTDHYRWWLLVLVASAGNVLGSVVNYGLGRALAAFEDRPWFPVRRAKIARAEAWYHAYGRWSLLLSWMPVIGDPLTIVAGVLRESFPVFLLLVTVAKVSRYIAVAAISYGWF
jgi:membrane protein YqaA with SNARE-associated domain